PSLDEVKVYLGISGSTRDAEVAGALGAEKAAQKRVCNIPTVTAVPLTLTLGSSTVTDGLRVMTAADVGARVSGSGVPSATPPTIVSVDTTAGTLVLSAAATATGVRTLTVDRAWDADLTEALFRRVSRNLAIRGLPLGIAVNVSEMAVSTRSIGGVDAEIARLESGYRAITVG
ncbi:MAG: hypothetical protein ACRCY8_06695, partial [Dermatophilaceae bacterium]